MNKRKNEDTDGPSSKRRRRSLANHFAQLSLSPVVDVEMAPVVPERPPTPVIPEVKMKSSSWYESERDRIVITDLESSSDEEEDTKPEITISPVFLEHIRARPRSQSLPLPPTSQALVLYRPLVIAEESEDKSVDSNAMDVDIINKY